MTEIEELPIYCGVEPEDPYNVPRVKVNRTTYKPDYYLPPEEDPKKEEELSYGLTLGLPSPEPKTPPEA